MIVKIDNVHSVNPDYVQAVEKIETGTKVWITEQLSFKTDVSYKKVIALLNGEKI